MLRDVATTSPSLDSRTACRTCSTLVTRLSSSQLSCPAVLASVIQDPRRRSNLRPDQGGRPGRRPDHPGRPPARAAIRPGARTSGHGSPPGSGAADPRTRPGRRGAGSGRARATAGPGSPGGPAAAGPGRSGRTTCRAGSAGPVPKGGCEGAPPCSGVCGLSRAWAGSQTPGSGSAAVSGDVAPGWCRPVRLKAAPGSRVPARSWPAGKARPLAGPAAGRCRRPRPH